MSFAETIAVARELISTPDRWCQGAYARDATGAPFGILDHHAVRRCAMGAIYDASNTVFVADEEKRLLEEAFGGNIAECNDAMTHAEVIVALTEAERLARERGL